MQSYKWAWYADYWILRGHLDGRGRAPGIQIAGLEYPEVWVYKRMVDLTEEYNSVKKSDKAEWQVRPERYGLRTVETASNASELFRLQEGADDFAQYLFDKYLKSSPNSLSN